MTKKSLSLPYEAKTYSQHAEDGIIGTLLDFLIDPNYIAIEIGSGNGAENMIRNLVANRSYRGFGHDLLSSSWMHGKYKHRAGLVTLSNLDTIVETWPTPAPDFFSLDIDSYDFWILKQLLSLHNFRPAIMCVEYLCYYGPDLVCSVKSDLESYTFKKCGASLSAYKKLLKIYGYEFFSCDSRGVNAFFYQPNALKNLDQLQKLPTHTWAFFTKYKYLQNISLNDVDLEFDQTVLFK